MLWHQCQRLLVCLKKIKMIWDRNFKNQIFTACILEFVFSDCLLQETIIDSCNKLCSVESTLKTLCGMVTMQWRFLPFWRGCLKIILKIIINKEYYCQMRRIMIGKLWNIKQMHQRKIVNIAALFFQNKSNLVPSIPRELKQWHCGCVWGGH